MSTRSILRVAISCTVLFSAGIIEMGCDPSTDEKPSIDQLETRAIGAAQDNIRTQLRDPESVQWIDIPSWRVVDFSNPKGSTPGLVCARFRAKNGFGGYDDEFAIVYLIISTDWNNAAVHFHPSRKEWMRMCVEPHPSINSAAKELVAEFAAVGLKP